MRSIYVLQVVSGLGCVFTYLLSCTTNMPQAPLADFYWLRDKSLVKDHRPPAWLFTGFLHMKLMQCSHPDMDQGVDRKSSTSNNRCSQFHITVIARALQSHTFGKCVNKSNKRQNKILNMASQKLY